MLQHVWILMIFMLSEMSQSQKGQYWIIHICEVCKVLKPLETENGTIGIRHCVRGVWGLGDVALQWAQSLIMKMEGIIEICCAMLCFLLTIVYSTLKIMLRVDVIFCVLTTINKRAKWKKHLAMLFSCLVHSSILATQNWRPIAFLKM